MALWLAVGFLLVVTLFAEPLAAQDAETAFREGIEAVDSEDWATVAEAMTRAIANRPAPGGRPVKIYGMRFEDYVPYFHLGRARERLGDCPAALAAWQRTEDPVLGRRRSRELEGWREQCRRMADRLDAARQTPLRPEPPEPTTRDTTSSQPVTNASPTADGDGADSSMPSPVAAGPWADAPPPPALRGAAADFLARRYGSALNQLRGLQEESLEHPGRQATVHLLTAACRFALWRLADDHNPQGEPPATVTDEIRAAKALDPKLRPAAFWFSPSFRALFERD